jgi:energy-coupling factor transporter transmembrane protein EcfT
MESASGIDATRDPRPKLLAYLIFVSGAMFAITTTAAMASALAYVVAVHAAARRGSRELVEDGRRLWVFVLLVVVLNGVTAPGRALVSVGGHEVLTREGLAAGVFFSLRLMVLYAATALLVRTSSPEELAAGIHASVRPVSGALADRLAFYAFMTMSFVPVFSEEMERVRVAQSFRGAPLSGRFIDRVRAAQLLVVPLVVSALHRSSQLAMVTELRGLQHRMSDVFAVAPPSARDAVLPVLTTAVVVGAAVGLG